MKILVNFYFQRWKEKIEMKKLYPFLNWNVLCMLNDEKCEALLRIIEAGHGKAVKFNNNNNSVFKSGCFTLIVYGEELKSLAETYSNQFNIPSYPYQAIPDYLMQV